MIFQTIWNMMMSLLITPKTYSSLPECYRHLRPFGEEVRFDHKKCKDTKQRLYVKRILKGYVYHCHNCGCHGIYSTQPGSLSPNKTLEQLQNIKKKPSKPIQTGNLSLSEGFDPILSMPAARWVQKYGILKEEATRYGFGMKGNRLILPVYDAQGKLIYYQARNLETPTKKNPKYLNVRAKDAKNVFFKSKGTYPHKTAVIVEDILSAIKTGRHAQSYALLGSYIPLGFAEELQEYDQAIIWLDPDKTKDAMRYSRQFTAIVGIPIHVCISNKDPKEHSSEYLANRIKRFHKTNV